ncbi:MAG: serine protease [Phycisphaerae bacterium]|nr:serine protease [Phycisphaerae bacterium]
MMRLPIELSLRPIVAMLLLFGFGLPDAWSQRRTVPTSKQPAEVTKARTKQRYKEPADRAKIHSSLQALYKQACPGVVRVICEIGTGEIQTGSGFFVSSTSLVVTNWHVISHKGLSGIRIETSGGVQLKANVLAIDREADLAILKPVSPIVVPHFFSGRSANDVRVGEAAVTVGHPSDARLLFSAGVVSGTRTVAEVVEAVEGKLSLMHGYRYLQTDVHICRSNSGGPLLDEKGRVLGVVTIGLPSSQVGFAIEWQAVADLMKKVDGARTIGLADIGRLSTTEQRERNCFGLVATAKEISLAAELARRNIYCGKCRGTGVVEEKVKVEKMERRRVFVTGPGVKPSYRYKWVTVTEKKSVPNACPLCVGHGISPRTDKLYQRLCDLVGAMSRVNEAGGQVLFAWRKGVETLQESAFDNIWHAGDLTEHARKTLATPQKQHGEAVVFIGKLQVSKLTRNDSHLLVVIYGTEQPVYVWCPGSVTALEGQWCQVGGVIGGFIENTPLVTAVNVSGLQVNPKLEPFEKPKPQPRRR